MDGILLFGDDVFDGQKDVVFPGNGIQFRISCKGKKKLCFIHPSVPQMEYHRINVQCLSKCTIDSKGIKGCFYFLRVSGTQLAADVLFSVKYQKRLFQFCEGGKQRILLIIPAVIEHKFQPVAVQLFFQGRQQGKIPAVWPAKQCTGGTEDFVHLLFTAFIS